MQITFNFGNAQADICPLGKVIATKKDAIFLTYDKVRITKLQTLHAFYELLFSYYSYIFLTSRCNRGDRSHQQMSLFLHRQTDFNFNQPSAVFFVCLFLVVGWGKQKTKVRMTLIQLPVFLSGHEENCYCS